MGFSVVHMAARKRQHYSLSLVRYTDPQGVFQHLLTYIELLSNPCDCSIEASWSSKKAVLAINERRSST